MFIGFLTGGQLGSLKDSLTWAAENGFRSISVTAGPTSEFLNVSQVLSDIAPTRNLLKDSSVLVSAIGFYGNPIHQDMAARRVHKEHFMNVMEVCHRLEVPVITGWIGMYPGTIEENVEEFKKEWPEMVERAEDYGIKIAIENCMSNIAHRPDYWGKLFDAIPSKNLGLEFDPSHLVCQMIDPIEAADAFGDRIYHTHVKDAQVLWRKVSWSGVKSQGWCPHRIPGFGQLNWPDLISVLRRHSYDYALSIEHEDPYFGYQEGLLLGKKFLDKFVQGK